MTRRDFEESSRRILRKDAILSRSELDAWTRSRDWLASQVLGEDGAPSRRRSPRARLTVPVHVAGIGNALTEDLGFQGLSLRAKHQLDVRAGQEQSVRVSILGRSIYATARVVWSDDLRMGLAITAIHPTDEYALQAVVCVQHLECWPD
jgi:hypothetical protein